MSVVRYYINRVRHRSRKQKPLVDTGDELVLDNRAVLFPVLAVLERAPLEVAAAAVDEDDDEKDGVEVWDGRGSANDKTPGE